MTTAEFRAVFEALARAWSARDYETAASAFAENVRYADPLRYRFESRAQLLDFFRNDEGCEQSTVWHNVVFDEDRQLGAAEYTYEGTHRYHGLVLIKVRGKEITHWREYQHVSEIGWEEFCAGTNFSKE